MVTSTQINQKKLQIKYVTRVYTLLEGYPTPLDILFDLLSDPQITTGYEFDFNYARYCLSCKIQKDEFYKFMAKLIDLNFAINVDDKKKIFKITNHPWK